MEEILEKFFYLTRLRHKNVLFITLTVVVVFLLAFVYFWISKPEIKNDNDQNNLKKKFTANKTSPEEKEITFDVKGPVKKPGVYKIAEGQRVIDGIKIAGGLSKNSDVTNLNLASKIKDGQMIVVGEKSTDNSESGDKNTEAKKISLNQADALELEEVPGIGPVKAELIIKYRQSHGSFSDINDLKNISGFGEKTIAKLVEYLTL